MELESETWAAERSCITTVPGSVMLRSGSAGSQGSRMPISIFIMTPAPERLAPNIATLPLLSTFAKGDRISIRINLPYNAIVQLIPLPPLTLHTENAHTIMEGAEVVAVNPPVIPGTNLVCDATPYTTTFATPLGPSNTVTITKTTGSAKQIVNILIIWDGTGGPVLQSITPITAGMGTGVSSINSSGPYYSHNVTWAFPSGTPSSFTITFSKVLKTPMIVRMTLSGADACSFGK